MISVEVSKYTEIKYLVLASKVLRKFNWSFLAIFTNKYLLRPILYQHCLIWGRSRFTSCLECSIVDMHISVATPQSCLSNSGTTPNHCLIYWWSQWYIIFLGEYFYSDQVSQAINAGLWFGYAVAIYRYSKEGTYEDSSKYYQVPAIVEYCRLDHENYEDASKCSQSMFKLLDFKDRLYCYLNNNRIRWLTASKIK